MFSWTHEENFFFSLLSLFCRFLKASRKSQFREGSMALGEDVAETDASVNTKVPSCGRWNSGEQELLPPGPEPQQPPHLEVKGGPPWRAEADTCCISGVFLSQAHTANREPVVHRSEPALSGPLPSASMETGDFHLSGGSHVSTEELRLELSQGSLWVCTVFP